MTLAPARDADVEELARALRGELRGEVDASTRVRAQYSADASNYRVVPQVVAFPVDTEDTLAALAAARRLGVPMTVRGAGTSVAGNAIGPGVVLDLARHQGRVLAVDPQARTARVQPGVILSDLQVVAGRHGLRFGPDPSTQNRATIGGMIGNNACGARALAYGRTADNVVALDVVDGTGRRFTAGRGSGALEVVPGLAELVRDNLAPIRTHLGRFSRQVSGYSLEHLLPERGSDLARMLVGTEGTLVTVLEAEVDLVEVARDPVLIVLGYPDMPTAAEAVPAVLPHRPLALEGLDSRLAEVVRSRHGGAPELPEGGGWLLVELGAEEGEGRPEVLARARQLAAEVGTRHTLVVESAEAAAQIWRIRSDGAGLAGRTPSGAPAWPGWEDAAVPPERLGPYLRDVAELMVTHDVDGVMFGHFGDGCMHVRLDLPLDRGADGVAASVRFLEASADLVASYGGSVSGEHGDGRARSALLPRMYEPEVMTLFSQVKGLFDPGRTLNPGVLVNPAPIDADLRRPRALPVLARTGFGFVEDGGDFTAAVHRCTGVGKCRADTSAAGGFMCPSYQATKDEKDVTRGRARVLQELTNGSLVTDWSAAAVHESLDLCLSCKACSSDCPAGVDMARYKSEVLHRAYSGKVRPRTHYLLGQLPRWSDLTTRWPTMARLANRVLPARPVSRLVLRLGGMDPRRQMVTFAEERFSRWWAHRPAVGEQPGGRVVLWADSFSETLDTSGARATARVLTEAGYQVIVPEQQVCCGLTWITTGQLDGAKARLREALDVLGPYVEAGIPVVGVEPSCTAVLRSDLPDLLPEDPRSAQLAAGTYTLAELLTSPAPLGPGLRWSPPSLTGLEVVAQPHCHHHSVMGWDTDEALLTKAGATITRLAGCCGLAGNFGMEQGHYDVSVAVAENALLPALRTAREDTVFLADGFSCRTQAQQLAGRTGVHLAQLLAREEEG